MSVQVRPATPDRWGDVVEAFGKRGEDASWCWCQRFLHNSGGPPWAARDNRSALHREITEAIVAPGLIAYVDDHEVQPPTLIPQAEPGLVRAVTSGAGLVTRADDCRSTPARWDEVATVRAGPARVLDDLGGESLESPWQDHP